MKIKDKIKKKLDGNKYTRRFSDYDFRTVFFTVISLVVTTGYAAFYVVFGFVFHSVWYGMLAWYYLMIVVMRATVVFYHRRKRKRAETAVEYREKLSRARIYIGCGIVIALLTLPLSIAILMMVSEHATFSHAGLMIYTVATYTTYKVVMTVRNLLKARRSTDMTVRSVRSINLADMLVSLLALQTAMFDSFSPNGDFGAFNAATGAAVCLSTVILGVFMIVNGRREIIKIKYEVRLLQTESAIEKNDRSSSSQGESSKEINENT